MTIPKTIWCFWDNNILPQLISDCITSWSVINPGYTTICITPKNINTYVSYYPNRYNELIVQKKSDWVRLYLLYNYGGIWIDGSMILTESLDWIYRANVPMIGFYNDIYTTSMDYPSIDNWFIASEPKTQFITHWFREYTSYVETYGNDGGAYLVNLKVTYGDEKYAKITSCAKITELSYLTMHVCAQKIMHIDGIKPYYMLPASVGPFKLSIRSAWQPTILALWLFSEITDVDIPKYMIKLTRHDRDTVVIYSQTMPIHNKSIYRRFIINSSIDDYYIYIYFIISLLLLITITICVYSILKS